MSSACAMSCEKNVYVKKDNYKEEYLKKSSCALHGNLQENEDVSINKTNNNNKKHNTSPQAVFQHSIYQKTHIYTKAKCKRFPALVYFNLKNTDIIYPFHSFW